MDTESDSIQNQKEMLQKAVKESGHTDILSMTFYRSEEQHNECAMDWFECDTRLVRSKRKPDQSPAIAGLGRKEGTREQIDDLPQE